MADKPHLSLNRIKLDKANTVMLVAIGIATFVLIFTVFAVKSYISQYGYQGRVIAAKKDAKTQLASDLKAAKNLTSSYQKFVGTTTNVLGGASTGTGPNDGDNAKIVLDALPSTYDFPGFITGMVNLMGRQGVSLSTLPGNDDQVAQQNPPTSGSPQPVQMPFELTATNNYANTQKMVTILQNSIRLINLTSLDMTGTDNALTTTLKAYTYYQPSMTFNITTKEVQ